jgi:hypothetical protein
MSNPNETRPESGPTPRPPPGESSPPPPAGQTAPHPRPGVPPPAPPVPAPIGGNVGGDAAGRDINKELNAGRHIVGRDAVTNTNTNVGFSAAAVQRLLVTVGALLAATAACFFVLGGVSALGIVAAFMRPVNSNNQAAADKFAAELSVIRTLLPGLPYELSFTEEEISSYFHLVIEPSLHGDISGGQVRLLGSGQLVFLGRAKRLNDVLFAASFGWQKNTPGAPLRLTGALLNVVPLGDSPLGWLAVPTAVLRPVADTVNGLFGNVVFTDVRPQPNGQGWDVTVVGQ